MANSSRTQESPEYCIFRDHYSKLCCAIQDPLLLAIQLFSREIINSEVKERMTIPTLSRLEKNNALLSAVEGQIRADPITFYQFLLALKEDTSMLSLVRSMEGKCFTCWDKSIVCVHATPPLFKHKNPINSMCSKRNVCIH